MGSCSFASWSTWLFVICVGLLPYVVEWLLFPLSEAAKKAIQRKPRACAVADLGSKPVGACIVDEPARCGYGPASNDER
ncbi:MAG: hypothetical protein C0423_03325 [Methylibium sp.]|nr:hypothetical protein [Methylibium sp.]